jgi:ABC-type phosphate transport system substrate-binding protein
MKFLSARGIALTCILSAVLVAAFALPGVAGATTVGKQCSSTAKVKGQGSTLQEEAELLWTEQFNISGNKYACNGTQPATGEKNKPVVEYLHPGSGSGHALRSWGASIKKPEEYIGPEPENAFLGTDEPPNRTQLGEIEKRETTLTPESVETIPVLEGAVAIIANLPEGCQATSKSNAGRLVFNDSTLEGIYRGSITKWSSITENGDKLSALAAKIAKVTVTNKSTKLTVASGGFPGVKVGYKVTGTGILVGTTVVSISGNELELSKAAIKTSPEAGETVTFTAACNAETAITPIVRRDGSGTTHIFKRYLNLINTAKFTDEEGKEVTWGEISEGGANTQWPAGVVTKEHKGAETCEGSPCMVTTVAETPSSVAYVNLADVRSNGAFSKKSLEGGPKFQKFWVPLQNKEGEESYQDPASNKDVEAKASANCAGEEFSNGSAPFPPPSVTAPWDEVTTKLTEPKYTLCGFTYVITLNAYSAFTVPTPTLEEATTVHDYLQFVLNTEGTAGKKGGQSLIVNRDYLPLAKGEVLTEAQNGANRVAF